MAEQENTLVLKVGVKSDPVVYRYSFEWLFDLMAEEGIFHLQMGSFFELYFLSDEYFLQLREGAEKRGIRISSVFSAHRELGGFMAGNKEFERITKRNYKRMIEIAEVVGSPSAGSAMGGVFRDRLDYRDKGIEAYIEWMEEIMYFAKEHGLEWLTLEPMSCYAEPPCNTAELRTIGSSLAAYHVNHPDDTVHFGYCGDISHGLANEKGEVIEGNEDYFLAAIPHLYEFHFKNTDSMFHETFGFEPENVKRGIVSVEKVRSMLLQNQDRLPVKVIIGYLELPGPKIGRDYTDLKLGRMLRDSLRFIKRGFLKEE